MKKIIGMIPARLGSQRIPKKNLRFLAGKPLIAYMIEAAKASNIFDELYINSEADIFKEIAEQYGIQFYKRPETFSTNQTNNDEFLIDFAGHISCDILVQLVPTSPLLTAEEIQAFIDYMKKGNYDTLVSVNNHQIACVYQNQPINFSLMEAHKSSQDMTPVQSYACVLMAWKYSNFLKNVKERGICYHGGKGKIGYFPLKGFSTIDIDNEEDFQLAEIALLYRQNLKTYAKKYYHSGDKLNFKTNECCSVKTNEND